MWPALPRACRPPVQAVVFAMVACAVFLVNGCYSFRTGSAPAHLKTIGIAPVDDLSGFGRGSLRQELTDVVLRRFRDDNSLGVVDPTSADSRLEVAITTVRANERLGVSSAEYETVRGVLVEVRATFYDNVKKKAIFKDRQIQARSQYRVAEGPAGENTALRQAFDRLADELINATVADW